MPVSRSQTVDTKNTRSYVASFTFAAADTSGVLPFGQYTDRSLQVVGTFTGTIVLKGSNDGVTFATLTDPAGAAISLTAAGLAQVGPATAFIMVDATGLTSGTPTAHLFGRE